MQANSARAIPGSGARQALAKGSLSTTVTRRLIGEMQ